MKQRQMFYQRNRKYAISEEVYVQISQTVILKTNLVHTYMSITYYSLDIKKSHMAK
jgi:hypothetical protein